MRPMKTTRTRIDSHGPRVVQHRAGPLAGPGTARVRLVHRRRGRPCHELRPPALVGLRELACGVGILSKRRPAGWVWARVAGDMMDIALLGAAMASGAPRRDRVVAATAAVLGVTAADLYDAVQLGGRHRGRAGGWGLREIQVRKAITVNRSPDEVYRFWRDFRNLPRFMHHLESVEVTDDRRSRWRTKAPAGMSVEWEAETVEDRPNEAIAWRSVEGSQVDNDGSVRFVPAAGGRGTEVHVALRYSPPGGVVGAAIAWLFGESADQQLYDDLRAFKQVIETGEVVVSEGTLGQRGYWQRPAAPGGSPSRLVPDWKTDPGRARSSRRGPFPRAYREEKTLESQLLDRSRNNVRVDRVPDPKILNPRDAIVRITSTAICGSDLHLYNGFIPTMHSGDILGHEFMGEVVEVGPGVKNLKVGDRVVVPFPIACGSCLSCERQMYSVCENSNPNAWMAEKMFGHSTAGIFGYSHSWFPRWLQRDTQVTKGNCIVINGQIFIKDRLFIPPDKELRLQILHCTHGSAPGGHPGNFKTFDLLCRTYYWL